MSSYTRNQLENYLKTLEVRGKVLDVGGSSYPLRSRVRVFAPTEYKILDNGAEESRDNWVEPDYKLDISDELFLRGLGLIERFDQMFMLETSEYLSDPIQALFNINAMLKKGGEFYSSWHFIYPFHPPLGKDYFRYTPDCVEMLLKKTGFKVRQHIPRKTEVANLRETWACEQMRGWKEMDNTIIGSIVCATK